MSQPEEAATPTDGASALLAAADKRSTTRRVRYVPKGKPGAVKPEPADPSQEPAAAPQEPADASAAPQSGDTARQEVKPPQKPSEDRAETVAPAAPTAKHEPPDAEPKAEAGSERESDDAGPPAPSSTTEVAFPPKQLDLASVFAPKPDHGMDPEMFKMVAERQVKLLKSLGNLVNMFNERRGEYENSVRSATAAGFPKAELARLAIAHDCLPFLEAVLGERLA